MRSILLHQLENGEVPYLRWLGSLSIENQAYISAYVIRVAYGASKKNLRPVGGGVYEIKIYRGPGYRVYFGELKRTAIILLFGGDKRTQSRDIARAKVFWRTYEQK